MKRACLLASTSAIFTFEWIVIFFWFLSFFGNLYLFLLIWLFDAFFCGKSTSRVNSFAAQVNTYGLSGILFALLWCFLYLVQGFQDGLIIFVFGSCDESFNVDGELDSITSWARSQIVLACLKTFLPTVEVHGGHLFVFWVWHVKVQWLRLADVRTSGNSEINELTLRDLPNCLIELLDVVGNFPNVLDRAVVGNEFVFNFSCPQVQFDKVFDEMFIYTDELSRQNTSRIYVSCKWLKTLIVTEYLRGRCRWHRCEE